MRTHQKTLTQEQKDLIERMLYGPYEPEWYENGIVDNTDPTIAKRLNLPISRVYHFTTNLSADRQLKL